MSKILVTGGSGFIGSNIVRSHLEKGDEVWVIDNLSTGKAINLQGLQLKRWDKLDLCELSSEIDQAVIWADRIYHMAAIVGMKLVLSNPVDTFRKNVRGLEVLLEAMVKNNSKAKILIASSSSVYSRKVENAKTILTETDMLMTPSGAYLQESYSLSKLANEVMMLGYHHQKKIPCLIARIFNTIGPQQLSSYGMVVPTFIEQALANQPITVYGDGKQVRSFCNVADTLKAFDLLFNCEEANGQIINIGNNHECSIHDLALLVKRLTKSDSPIEYIPYKNAYGVDFQDVQVRKPNIDKLYHLTGFKPEWSLEQTVAQIIENKIKEKLK